MHKRILPLRLGSRNVRAECHVYGKTVPLLDQKENRELFNPFNWLKENRKSSFTVFFLLFPFLFLSPLLPSSYLFGEEFVVITKPACYSVPQSSRDNPYHR